MSTAEEDVICKCGHPQRRHAFQVQHCTVKERAPLGVGYISCRCVKFESIEVEVEDETPTS